jgi:hypothetical protein
LAELVISLVLVVLMADVFDQVAGTKASPHHTSAAR